MERAQKCDDCSGYKARLIALEQWVKQSGETMMRLVAGRPSWPVVIVLSILLSACTFLATELASSSKTQSEAQTATLKLSQQMQDGFASINERLLKLERRP